MPPLGMLIKPASSLCDLRCKYCFYSDITKKRDIENFGIMSVDTLEVIVKKAFEYAEGAFCTFAFQGGEPTLAGFDFFQELIEFQKKYNKNNVAVHNAIQTNGVGLSEKWASFFADNKFLVGISLDGTEHINNLYRTKGDLEGTFGDIMNTISLFNAKRVEYNILTVVSKTAARNITEIYNFYKENNFSYQQYIPCLDPLYEERGSYEYSLTPKAYEKFLKRLFDLWFDDIEHGVFIYNRYFENLVGMLKGYPPEICNMMGRCTCQNVIEADGGVYPCDFYVLDKYKIGNILEDDFESISKNRKTLGFVETSLRTEEKCRNCSWFKLCRGGCRRDRDFGQPEITHNYYCSSYKNFFEYSFERLSYLAEKF